MTPLRTIAQQVNDAPYTTPAKRGPKIGSRAYCGYLIFGGPLLRTSLNDRTQIAEEQFVCKRVCFTVFDKHLIPCERRRINKSDNFLTNGITSAAVGIDTYPNSFHTFWNFVVVTFDIRTMIRPLLFFQNRRIVPSIMDCSHKLLI